MQFESMISTSPYLTGPLFRDGWAKREKCICRITTTESGNTGGTGFLVGPDVVLTCFHVLMDIINQDDRVRTGASENVRIEFEDLGGDLKLETSLMRVRLKSGGWLIHYARFSQFDFGKTNGLPNEDELDFALIRLDRRIGEDRGWIDLEATRSSASLLPENPFLAILQHPGLRAQAAAFDSSMLEYNGNGTRVRYHVNTEPGSSGSPCFDQNWNLVAVHHAGAYTKSTGEKFNQGVPVSKIVTHITASGIDLRHGTSHTKSGPQKAICGFEPTLIIICNQADFGRAEMLIAQAAIPPQFVARIGNSPPATVADNAIGVYLGSSAATADMMVRQSVEELRNINLQVVPIVPQLDSFSALTPKILQAFNGVEWPVNAPPPPSLCSRIRQLLGLEVAPSRRSVFISYHREDSRHQIAELKTALEAEGYRVFVDKDDIPPGEPVQSFIENQISCSGSNALLFVESENAYKSKWIHDELLWAYTRELGIVVCQAEAVRNRIPLIGAFPVLPMHRQALKSSVPEIARWLDHEIAVSGTRNVQLARTIEGIAKNHSKSNSLVAVETRSSDTSLMELRYSRSVGMGEFAPKTNRCVLVKNSSRRPTATIIQQLIDEQNAIRANAAVLLYDAPELPLTANENRQFRQLCGNLTVSWVTREKVATELVAILDEVA